jgi:integrase
MLSEAIDTYLNVRRALGFKLDTVQGYLASYADFATSQGDMYVRAQSAIQWAELATSEASRGRRLDVLIRFARFAHADNNQHEIPPTGIFCSRHCRRQPYIFSDDEVQRIVQQARQLGPLDSLRPYTYSTLFGLLAATGMRISEGLALRINDITPDGLLIRETKFRKSRLVCLHDSVAAVLNRYLTLRSKVVGNDDHIFVSHRGGHRLHYHVAAETFSFVLDAAGINGTLGMPRPRLHDLRHRFAIKALLACPDSRCKVTQHMLALTTYMGHAHVGSTYWYLDSTPQLMNDIANACEAFLKGNDP